MGSGESERRYGGSNAAAKAHASLMQNRWNGNEKGNGDPPQRQVATPIPHSLFPIPGDYADKRFCLASFLRTISRLSGDR